MIQTDKKTGEIVKTKELVVLLEEKIQKYKETMGFYSIVTLETEMNDQEVINKYHGLSRIEDSFRIIKSDLEGRPVHVWTKEHINAHFLICFIALTMIRIIQYKILKSKNKNTLNVDGWEQGITAEKLKETLNKYQVNLIGDGYYQVSKEQEEIKILKQISNIDKELYLPDISQINGLKRSIASIKL